MMIISNMFKFIKRNQHKSNREKVDKRQLLDNGFDEVYIDFINTCGTGYFFSGSLHIYSITTDVYKRSEIINRLYSEMIVEELIVFGEELFGNQFVFYSAGIGLLNIETGKIDNIGNNFVDWLTNMEHETDYFTGESLLLDWKVIHGDLKLGFRLNPKLPFVAGGGYEVENLYAMESLDQLEFNASIARQIYDLPDGTEITFDFD